MPSDMAREGATSAGEEVEKGQHWASVSNIFSSIIIHQHQNSETDSQPFYHFLPPTQSSIIMTQITKLLAVAAALLLAVPVTGAPLQARQLAGEGNACSSLLSSTDNGVGYGIENAEDNTAKLIGGGAGAPAGGAPKIGSRQGDKIANGAANMLNAAGQPGAASFVKTNGDNVDGQLTDDATNIGAQFGGDEESMLEGIGSSIP